MFLSSTLHTHCAVRPCTVPSLGTGVIRSPQCGAGATIPAGSSCTVQCAAGWSKLSGTNVLTCSSAGAITTRPTLVCKKQESASCNLPASFGPGIVRGTCSPSTVAYGVPCDVKCDAASNWEAVGGSAQYACSAAGVLTSATLQCTRYGDGVPGNPPRVHQCSLAFLRLHTALLELKGLPAHNSFAWHPLQKHSITCCLC